MVHKISCLDIKFFLKLFSKNVTNLGVKLAHLNFCFDYFFDYVHYPWLWIEQEMLLLLYF